MRWILGDESPVTFCLAKLCHSNCLKTADLTGLPPQKIIKNKFGSINKIVVYLFIKFN
jgi:hypothetical protein